ncbi:MULTISPECIES: acyl-CoA dehydrogenase [unclassified Nocardioides]|uniref:acyl-CoA dehydrogenase n=1 Tax=unclassified Nocardioides TaxID=2615069 RepID=UPI001054808F|nr:MULTISPECIES: acyl-CoA dehydrogenase [unclassified Nocardioides]
MPPHRTAAVTLGPGDRADATLTALAADADDARGDVPRALELAVRWGTKLSAPGRGHTRPLWEALATLGAVDLTVARVVEPHLDALAILDEPRDGAWGVWAAETPGARLRAEATPHGYVLNGRKPWCSLAADLSHALVTAWVGDEQRQLFAVDLHQPGVSTADAPWVARGLGTVRSTPVDFDDVVARPVGEPEWYLRRDGFAWGGIGVAAVWYGGSVGVARRLWRQAAERELDQIGQLHLGRVDAALTAASSVLLGAAVEVDAGRAAGVAGALAALRVRQVVADAAETVLLAADHALGPAPLTTEDEHAGRVADLRVYLRQHHAERDTAALGRLVSDVSPW